MAELSPINQILLQLKELQQSEVYQYHCRLFSDKCVQFSEVVQRMISQEEALQTACQEHTVRKELVVQSRYLYRGFYCPSPVYDLIVGNARRGRILKKPNKKSKPTHIYGFDSNGNLLWCQNNEQKCCEYLVYENNQIYGISFYDKDGSLASISEETYQDGKLISFYVAYFHGFEPHECTLKAELYEHDHLGLYNAKLFEYIPPSESIPDFMHDWGTNELLTLPNCHCIGNYHFERTDGMLVSYRRHNLVTGNPCREVYTVEIPRKA